MKFFFLFLLLFVGCFTLHSADIAVVTIAAGNEYKNAVKAGIANKELYCKKHGYDFFCITETLDSSRAVAWSKVLLILRTLKDYRWVFWTDADSLIMNSNIKLESLIDDHRALILTRDPVVKYNTGQFLIKNCPWSFKLLNDLYAHKKFANCCNWEQAAFIDLVKRDPSLKNQIKRISQRKMNSFDQFFRKRIPKSVFPKKITKHTKRKNYIYQPGDFIIHFPATRNLAELKKYMDSYASLAK